MILIQFLNNLNRKDNTFSGWVAIIAVFIAGLTLPACEYSFEPLQENNNLHFSIYGTIDASLDTQSIRVTPIRTLQQSTPESINATVILQQIDGHQSSELEEYIVSIDPNSWVHNFKTDMEIHPEVTYSVTVSSNMGVQSHTSTTLPNDFPDPTIRFNCINTIPYNNHVRNYIDTIHMTIRGVDRLVAFDIIYYYRIGDRLNSGLVQENVRIRRVNHFNDVIYNNAGNIYYSESDITEYITELQRQLVALDSEPSAIYVDSLSVYIASGGPDWPDPNIANTSEVTVPQEYTNVENGVGVLAGIVSKTIMFENVCQ